MLALNAASVSYESGIYFQQGGSTFWELYKGSTTGDFGLYNFYTGTNAFTINRSNNNVNISGALTGTSATFNTTGTFGGAISSGSYIVAQSGIVSYDPGGSELNRFGGTTKFGGAVNIGTTQSNANLYVQGLIKSKEVKVEASVTVPDYVFENSYDLMPLGEVEKYVAQNKHLPEIPSAKEIGKEGLNVGEMQMQLLKKIEELTLHLIEQNKRLENQEEENISFRNEIDTLKKKNQLLEKEVVQLKVKK